MKKGVFFLVSLAALVALAAAWAPTVPTEEQRIELGRKLFFEKKLSAPDGESCTVCHSPRTAFSDPFHTTVSEGMLAGFFVNRNSPSLTYVKYVPPLTKNEASGEWYGGLFWDGRSSSLEHQLSGPFFNIAEMNNRDTAQLAADVPRLEYYREFKKVYGKSRKPGEVYEKVVDAIAAFERSEYLHAFTSKFDNVLRGSDRFTPSEQRGWELFQGKAQCASCHTATPVGEEGRILFTDYSYHNLGVPRNEQNPFYTTDPRVNPLGRNAIDLGLGAVVNDPQHNGKFRTPTLRNVMETAPYFHNGWAPDIAAAVNFVLQHHSNGTVPEVPGTVEQKLTGRIELTADEKTDLIAFLNTLTDL